MFLVRIALRALCLGYYTHREKEGYGKNKKKLFWIYDMDEATPSPTCDCAYYEYMIGIKPPPDYAYSEYKGDPPPKPYQQPSY